MLGDLVPVERLTRATDRFRCDHYRAVISAATCLGRQSEKHAPGRSRYGMPFADTYPGCVGCSVGAEVARTVPRPPPPAATLCAVCKEPVQGARGKRPLCPRHRVGAR
jgi:hypothetical protein